MEKENVGFEAGIARRSKIERLAWALKGAPPRTKDLRLNALAGVAEGRKLRDRVTGLMKRANAKPEDAIVLCVFAKHDFSACKSATVSIGNGAADLALAAQHVDALPLGFLIFVWAKQEQSVFGHARPLIVEDRRALALIEQSLQRSTERIKKRYVALGLIQDANN